MNIDTETAKTIIARRVAQELKDGQLVNLGIGLPTLASNYMEPGVNVILQSENGMIYMGPEAQKGQEDPCVTNAGGVGVTILPGGAYFDSSLSFALIRGGHVDVTVLGTLEVDQEGNIASWIIPGKLVPGMGGAMDLLCGARKVIVATTHTAKGKPKILKRCSLPLTAEHEVDLIITEMAVMKVTAEGLVVEEIHPDTTVAELRLVTGADLIISPNLRSMAVL